MGLRNRTLPVGRRGLRAKLVQQNTGMSLLQITSFFWTTTTVAAAAAAAAIAAAAAAAAAAQQQQQQQPPPRQQLENARIKMLESMFFSNPGEKNGKHQHGVLHQRFQR